MTDTEWLEKYALIRNESGMLVRVKLRRPQIRYLRLRAELRKRHQVPFIVVLKARQIGMSSAVALANLMDAIRHEGCRVAIVSNKNEVCRYIARRYMWEPLIAMINAPDCRLRDDYEIEIEGNFAQGFGSDVLFTIGRRRGLQSEVSMVSAFTGKRSGRSMTTHILHLSEVAYWAEGADGQRAQEAIRAMLSSVPDYEQCPFASITVESTAWGRAGLFHELWQNATQGALGMAALFSPWYECEKYRLSTYPGPMPTDEDALARIFARQLGVPIGSRDVARWIEYCYKMRELIPPEEIDGAFWWLVQNGLRKCGGSLAVFKREFPITPDEAFTLLTENFFSDATLERVASGLMISPWYYDVLSHDSPPYIAERDGDPTDNVVFAVYLRPKPGERYVIGVDCAVGSAYADYRPQLAHAKSATVISVWRVDGEQAAEWWAVGMDAPVVYQALCAIARAYNNAVINIERNSVGKWLIDQVLTTDGMEIFWSYGAGRGMQGTPIPGSIVSPATRDEIISRFRWAIDRDKMRVRSVGLYKEMAEFVVKDGIRPEGLVRDDRIWAAAHACTVLFNEHAFHEERPQREQEVEDDVSKRDALSAWVSEMMRTKLPTA